MSSSGTDRHHCEAALDYARRGWAVFPVHGMRNGHCACSKGAKCEHPAKHPATKQGFKDATTDEEQIAKWWQRTPTANIGIATGTISGIVVLDIDGEAGTQSLRDAGVELPDTITARTGGGGWHHYYAAPQGGLPSRVGILTKVDVRGDGGYVVAPPSVHASGVRYEWV